MILTERNMELMPFVAEHIGDDVGQLALKRKLYPALSEQDMFFVLQQIEGRQKARHKLPTISANMQIWFPRRLSVEQCSSELTAKYKLSIIPQPIAQLVDLTGGFGVDTCALANAAKQTHYVERNEELCQLAEHNFPIICANNNIKIHNTDAETYISQMQSVDCVYIDPARRDSKGNKVIKLEECEPNLALLWQPLTDKSRYQLVKLSPMIDLSNVVALLNPSEIHIVAVDGECKEVIALCGLQKEMMIKAVNMSSNTEPQQFEFTIEDERNAQPQYAKQIGKFIYEPNSALMKAAPYNLIAQRYDIQKLAPNTHLYTSDVLVADFQGRVWQVDQTVQRHKDVQLSRANVIARNYPLSAQQICHDWHIKDGGDQYLIATTISKQKIIILAHRV